MEKNLKCIVTRDQACQQVKKHAILSGQLVTEM